MVLEKITSGGRDEKKGVNRRKCLKAVGAATATTTWFSQTVAALKKDADERGLKVQTMSGKARKNAIEAAQSDEVYQKISAALSADGFVPQAQKADCKRTTYTEEEGHRTVVVPFKKSGRNSKSESAHILWLDESFGTYRVLGFRFERSSNSLSTSSNPSTEYSERYVVDDGKVKTKESDYHTLEGGNVGTQAHLPGDGGGGCGDLCQAEATVCDSPNYQCWSAIAGAYGGAIVLCGKCAASFSDDTTCAACMFAVMTAYGVDCNIGSGCETVTGCYECKNIPNVT